MQIKTTRRYDYTTLSVWPESETLTSSAGEDEEQWERSFITSGDARE